MKYEFIEKHRFGFEVGKMCRALKVAGSGYYRWGKEPMSRREKGNEKLLKDILEIHQQSRFVYGSLRVHAESLFHTIKLEEVYGNVYRSKEIVKSMMFDYIEVFYNCVLKHSGLGYLSCVFKSVSIGVGIGVRKSCLTE